MTKPTEADCGWIKLHRQILDSKLWSFSDATFRVAVYLLLSANHKERYVRGLTVVPGQTVRSITRIADDCHLSKKAVRYAMQCLIDDGFAKKDEPFGAHQGHRVTICKYGDYQCGSDDKGTPGAHAGNPAGNPAGNTNKNEENEKNGINPLKAPQGAGRKSTSNMTLTVKKQTSVEANTPMMVDLGKAFGRREATKWSIYEAEALHRVDPTAEDVALMVAFYKADFDEKSNPYRRRNLETLLNNWRTELDKAGAWNESRGIDNTMRKMREW